MELLPQTAQFTTTLNWMVGDPMVLSQHAPGCVSSATVVTDPVTTQAPSHAQGIWATPSLPLSSVGCSDFVSYFVPIVQSIFPVVGAEATNPLVFFRF